MPRKPATICNGCGKPARGPCPRCRRKYEKNRPTANERGYGARWQKLRRYILSLHPMCQHCKRQVSTEVDHIKRKADGGDDDVKNLQGLCKECHKIKTLRQSPADHLTPATL